MILRRGIQILAIAGLIGVPLFIILFNGNHAEVAIINKCGLKVKSGSLKISSLHDMKHFGPLSNGDTLYFQFQNYSDGEYFIEAILENGDTIRAAEGYVTHSMSFKDQIELLPSLNSCRVKVNQNTY